jgi:hypothetical protein
MLRSESHTAFSFNPEKERAANHPHEKKARRPPDAAPSAIAIRG